MRWNDDAEPLQMMSHVTKCMQKMNGIVIPEIATIPFIYILYSLLVVQVLKLF